jgi:hypothetical protein
LSEAAIILGGVLDDNFPKLDASYIHFCTTDKCNNHADLGLSFDGAPKLAAIQAEATLGLSCNTLLGHIVTTAATADTDCDYEAGFCGCPDGYYSSSLASTICGKILIIIKF